jgi:hypothetical protein
MRLPRYYSSLSVRCSLVTRGGRGTLRGCLVNLTGRQRPVTVSNFLPASLEVRDEQMR